MVLSPAPTSWTVDKFQWVGEDKRTQAVPVDSRETIIQVPRTLSVVRCRRGTSMGPSPPTVPAAFRVYPALRTQLPPCPPHYPDFKPEVLGTQPRGPAGNSVNPDPGEGEDCIVPEDTPEGTEQSGSLSPGCVSARDLCWGLTVNRNSLGTQTFTEGDAEGADTESSRAGG